MRAKRILFIATGTRITASSRLRVYNYKPWLEKSGFQVIIVPYNMAIDAELNVKNRNRNFIIKAVNKINQFFKCLIYILMAPWVDIVVIQRVLLPMRVFSVIKRLAGRVVFDFDDAIYLADEMTGAAVRKDKFFGRFRHITRNSDLVIASNNELKAAAGRFAARVIIFPTPVDTEAIKPRSDAGNSGNIVIGWIGSVEKMKDYIMPLKDVFDSLSAKFPFLTLNFVGGKELEGWSIKHRVKDWNSAQEAEDLQGFDIGIMPLVMNKWTVAKGGYKLIQYMAVGIPSVASPIGVNSELIKNGVNGFLADSNREWSEKLEMLISDPRLRLRMGQAGRKMAEDLFSYKTLAPRLIKLLNELDGGK